MKQFNPFVYAFSNRCIRQAFREVICRRCCCCICRKRTNQGNGHRTRRRQRGRSSSLTTDTSQITSKVPNAPSVDVVRTVPQIEHDDDTSSHPLFRGPTTGGPVVSFADFLAGADGGDDDDISSHDDKRSNHEFIPISTKEHLTTTSDA